MRTTGIFILLGFFLFSCQIKPDVPDYLTSYNAGNLALTRKKTKEEESCLHTIYQNLVAEAQTMLDAPCPSVMLKKSVPPSGNKHDYMSLGPYWWPDSTSENGLPYIRRDGRVNPEARKENTDYLAMRQMLNMGETLTLAYLFSGNQKFAEKAAICLRVWFMDEETRMSPHLQYAQAIRGINSGRFIGIIETATFGRIGDWATILSESDYWTAEDHEALKHWFESYLDWLMHSEFGIEEANWPNNHGTWFDVQAVSIAQFLGKHEIAREILNEVKTRRLDKQLTPEGSQPHELERTKSLSYSVMNLRGYYLLAHMASHEGIDLWHYQTLDNPGIKGATDFLVNHALENPWAHEQLTGLEKAKTDLVILLDQASAVYETDDYKKHLNEYSNALCDQREALWMNLFNE